MHRQKHLTENSSVVTRKMRAYDAIEFRLHYGITLRKLGGGGGEERQAKKR